MLFKNRQVGEVTVVELQSKELDASVASEFKDFLIDMFEKEPTATVALDFSKVRFMDSTCLGGLISAYRQTGSNKKLVIAEAQGAVQHMFKVARLTKMMPVVDTLYEALALKRSDWPSNVEQT